MTNDNTPLNRRTFVKVTGGATAAGLVGLAGCSGGGDGGDGGSDGGGGGDGGSTGTTSGGSTGGTETSSEPITIAATLPQTGAFSSLYEEMHIGYTLGVKAINGAGGINGRQVELVVKDDESDPEKVRTQLQQIVSENDVQMIWGSFSSLLATAGSAFAENQQLPFLAVAFASEAPHLNNNYKWTFAPFPKSRDVAISCTEMLNALDSPPQKIGLWELNSSWGAEQADAWESHFKDAGYEIVMREKYSKGTSDFSSLISQSQSAGVEALFSNPIPPDGIAAVKQMKSSAWAPTLIHFVRAADPQAWWSALGQDGAYVQMAPGWLPGMQGGGNQDLMSAYSNLSDKPTDVPLAMVGATYGLTQTAHQAMKAAGTADKNAVREALLSTTFDTTLGKFDFEDNGMPVEGQITAPIGQWWKGRQALVHPQTDSQYSMATEYPIPAWGDR